MTVPWRDVFPAMTTQFRRDESHDLETTCRHVERMIASGCSGLVMLGSLGENAALTAQEKRRVVSAAIEAAAGRVPVIATVIETSTAAAEQDAREQETGLLSAAEVGDGGVKWNVCEAERNQNCRRRKAVGR